MISYPLSVWLTLLGVIIAALISAIRMTLQELSLGTLRRLEARDPELALLFEGWLERREEYRIVLRVILLAAVALIVLAGGSWTSQRLAAEQSPGATLLMTAIVTMVYFLVSELFGRDLGASGNRYLLKMAMTLVKIMAIPLYPIAAPVAAWHRFLHKRYENAVSEQEKITAEDEIMSLVEQDEQMEGDNGGLDADERRMIKGIFDLDETLVKEIMTPRVDIDSIEDTASLAEVKALIVSSGHSRIPVHHGTVDHILGLVHAKDLLDQDKAAQANTAVDILHPTIFIPQSKNIGDLLAEFQQNEAHFAVVVDEYGGTEGIVTLEDILEEIVGEIRDEYDGAAEIPEFNAIPDGSYMVTARTSIYDLNEELELHIPEDEDFDTLGGYVSFVLGRIPKRGELVDTPEFTLQVMEADERRIGRAKLTLKQSQRSEDRNERKRGDEQ